MIARDTKCFTIAVGEAFHQIAELTVPLIEKHIGLPVELLTEAEKEDPFRIKLHLLERHDGHVLFIDADAIVRSWDWGAFDFSRFNAALAVRNYDAVRLKWPQRNLGFPLHWCFNSGVWLASRKHRKTFQKAWHIVQTELRHHPHKLGDQSALNTALFRDRVKVNRLPETLNYAIAPDEQAGGQLNNLPPEVHVVHIVGNTTSEHSPQRKLARVREAMAKMGLL